MTSRLTEQRDMTVYASGVVAAIWVVLAFIDPDKHYYLAPVLIAMAFPVAHRFKEGRLSLAASLGAGFGGMLNVVVVTTLLSLVGRLKGPALFSWGGPASEAFLFGAVGAIIGALVAYSPTPRLLRR